MTSPLRAEELAALERLAKASRDEWGDAPHYDAWYQEGGSLFEGISSEVDRHFIAAASPDVILTLLASLRAAEARAGRLESALSDAEDNLRLTASWLDEYDGTQRQVIDMADEAAAALASEAGTT